MTDVPPDPDIRSYDQLINADFRGGQAHILKLRNLIKTLFYGGSSGPGANSQDISLKEFSGYNPNGVVAGNADALEKAVAAATRNGRGRVFLPPGDYRLEKVPNFSRPWVADDLFVEIVGAGEKVTRIIGYASGNDIITLGTTASQSGNMAFRNLGIVLGNTSMTGYAFVLERCRDVLFQNINLLLPSNGWAFGPATVSSTQKCVEIVLDNCSGRLKSNAGGSWINLIAGELIHVLQGQTVGRADQYFINQASAVGNTDGLYVFGHKSAQWGTAIRDVGLGIVNFRFDCHQFDRAKYFIQCAGAAGGTSRDWQVRGQFLGQAAGSTSADPAFIFDCTTGATVDDIVIHNSSIYGRLGPVATFTKFVGSDRGPYVLFSGNNIISCGRSGTVLFAIGEDANPSFYGNVIKKGVLDAAEGDYTYAFDYAGLSTGRRNDPTDVNTILDAGTGAVNGTP